MILDKLLQVLAKDGVNIRGVYERSDAKVRLQEGMERFKGFIGEPFDTKVEIDPHGLLVLRLFSFMNLLISYFAPGEQNLVIFYLYKSKRQLSLTMFLVFIPGDMFLA